MPSLSIKIKPFFFAIITALSLTACGGGGGGATGSPNNSQTDGSGDGGVVDSDSAEATTGNFDGVFVEGLSYRTPTKEGKITGQGEFEYVEGEEVEILAGGLSLGSFSGLESPGLYDLFGTYSYMSDPVINRVRLLLSIDVDDDPSNGIQIPDRVSEVAEIDFTNSVYGFNQFNSVAKFIEEMSGESKALVPISDAVTFLADTLAKSNHHDRPSIFAENETATVLESDDGIYVPFDVKNFYLGSDGDVSLFIDGFESTGFDSTNKLIGLAPGRHTLVFKLDHHSNTPLGDAYSKTVVLDVIDGEDKAITLVGHPPFEVSERILFKSKGMLLTDRVFSATLNGIAQPLSLTMDDTLSFEVPDLAPGTYPLAVEVDSEFYNFSITVEASNLPADGLVYMESLLNQFEQDFLSLFDPTVPEDLKAINDIQDQVDLLLEGLKTLSEEELNQLVQYFVANQDWLNLSTAQVLLAQLNVTDELIALVRDDFLSDAVLNGLFPKAEAVTVSNLGSEYECLATLKPFHSKLDSLISRTPESAENSVNIYDQYGYFSLIPIKRYTEFAIMLQQTSWLVNNVRDGLKKGGEIRQKCTVPLQLTLKDKTTPKDKTTIRAFIDKPVAISARIQVGIHPSIEKLIDKFKSLQNKQNEYKVNVLGFDFGGIDYGVGTAMSSIKRLAKYEDISTDGDIGKPEATNSDVKILNFSALSGEIRVTFDLKETVKSSASFDKEKGCTKPFKFKVYDSSSTRSYFPWPLDPKPDGRSATQDVIVCSPKPTAETFKIQVKNGGEHTDFLKGEGHEYFEIVEQPSSTFTKELKEPAVNDLNGKFTYISEEVDEQIFLNENGVVPSSGSEDGFKYIAVNELGVKSKPARVWVNIVPNDAPTVNGRVLQKPFKTQGSIISMTATDDVGIEKIELFVDGASAAVVTPPQGSTYYKHYFTADPEAFEEGEYEAKLVVTDSSNKVSEWTGTIIVEGCNAEDLSGIWVTDYGTRIDIQVGNGSLFGSWDNGQGYVGQISGTVNGLQFKGSWSEAPTYSPPDDAGDAEWSFSSDGKRFSGSWRYGSEGGWYPWSANKEC